MYAPSSNNGFRPFRRAWLFFPFIFIAVGLLMGSAVMWLWNAILPEITGWKVISFWQALGLLALCRILFGGFRFGRPGGGRHRGGAWRERWMNMNEDERARMRAAWEARCGRKPPMAN